MTDRERGSLLAGAADGLLLLCALGGFTGSFLSLYGSAEYGRNAAYAAGPLDLCAAHTDRFLLLAGLFALLSLGAWSLPRLRAAVTGGLGAVLVLAAALNRTRLVQGAGLTLHRITVLFSQRVREGRVFHYDPGLTRAQQEAATALFLILALALLALALGWAVVRARRWWAAALLTLPPLLPGLLADYYPDWLSFMALSACWCAMLLADLCKWAAPSRRGALVLVSLGCAAAALSGITLAFPREGYARPQWALRAEEELHSTVSRCADYFSQMDGPFQGGGITYVGAAAEADLSGAGPLRYTGRTVLRVTSDYAGRLYLRGSSLADYEDGVWQAMADEAFQNATAWRGAPPRVLFFPVMSAGPGPEYTITVNNLGAVGNCVYAPYFISVEEPEESGMTMVNDSLLARRQGRWTHTMTFMELPRPRAGGAQIGDVPTGGGADFGKYPQFVYDHYLEVPEELKDDLSEFCIYNSVYGAFGGVSDPIEAAEEIAALLEELCRYDQSVKPPPEGADPVLYFLNESRRGYCMHYASAAALILRSLGVPARYVSGFTAESVPNQQVDVPDWAAHAWVEVWVNGFGWYPVEVTPPAAFTWYEQGALPSDGLPSEEAEESEIPEESDPLEDSEGPENSERPGDTPAPTQAGAEPPQGQGGGGGLPGAALAVSGALAAILGAAALLWLGQYMPKRRRARRMAGPDPNRAALYAYRCLCRMERWGGKVDRRAVELAQKAKFSQHTLTPEELEELRALADGQRERLCVVLPPLPRLAFRYFWGVPKKPRPGKNPPAAPDK